MQLSTAIELFLESKTGIRSDATVNWYNRMLRSIRLFLGDVDIQEITTQNLRRWRTSLTNQKRWESHPTRPADSQPLSPSTQRGHIRACRIFFRWLEQEDILQKNPAQRLELPPQPKGEPKKDISQDDALQILNAAKYNPRDYAILAFMADTGCRAEGVTHLRITDLNGLKPDNHGYYRAVVREKGQGREHKARIVYMTEATAKALARYLEIRPEARTNRLFLSQRTNGYNQPLTYSGLYQMIKRYAHKAGVEGRWNPHAWRHTFAHNLLDQGADLGAVSQLMGHSSIAVTIDFYGQRADEKLAFIHAQHSWIDDAKVPIDPRPTRRNVNRQQDNVREI